MREYGRYEKNRWGGLGLVRFERIGSILIMLRTLILLREKNIIEDDYIQCSTSRVKFYIY